MIHLILIWTGLVAWLIAMLFLLLGIDIWAERRMDRMMTMLPKARHHCRYFVVTVTGIAVGTCTVLIGFVALVYVTVKVLGA